MAGITDTVSHQELHRRDEDWLLQAAKDGDDEAYGELVRRYQARLRAYTSQYIDNSQDVFEIVQDAFLNTYRNFDRFDVNRPFYPWIRTICHNLVLNYFRARRSKRRIHLQLVDSALCERITADPRYEEADNLERIEILRECIRELPEEQQELIRQRYGMGAAVQDLAEFEDTTPGAVSMKLLRIRKRLKSSMEERLRQSETDDQG